MEGLGFRDVKSPYDRLPARAEGADDSLGYDGEGTIDGSHPTDLGFARQAAEMERALPPILK